MNVGKNSGSRPELEPEAGDEKKEQAEKNPDGATPVKAENAGDSAPSAPLPGGRQADGRILLHLANLHCAACALDLEDEIRKIRGVGDVRVDFITQTILLTAETDDAVRKAIRTANRFEKVRVLDGDLAVAPKETHGKEIAQIAVAAALALPALVLSLAVPGRAALIVSRILFAAAYLVVGCSVLIATLKNVVKGRIFDENFLMTVASIGAVCLGEWGEGVAVMLLYQLGELLQSIAVGSSRRSVSRLMELKSESATLLENGESRTVRPEELRVGDIVLIKAGERVPADGILLDERALLDTKSLTGESEPREAKREEEILSGCINAGGVFRLKIVRAYENSAVRKILDLVENSSAQKAAPEKFIAKFARYYTPAVCILAVLVAVAVPVLSGLVAGGGYAAYFRRWIQSALNFLVISCPCALVISVPLTYFSGVGCCARKGILVKGATYLDVAAKIRTVAFDKTGTLTEGRFSVSGTVPAAGCDSRKLLEVAAAAERGAAHPIAGAFEEISVAAAAYVTEIAGKGISARVGGQQALVGSAAFLAEEGVASEVSDSVWTQVCVALDGRYLGRVEIGDRLRPEAGEAIGELRALGIERIVMLTGDGNTRAESIAAEAGISETYSGLLPDEKLERAQGLRREGPLMYIGDGINDAPVMAVADCSVSMGTLGSAAAVEASDLVLVSDRLTAIPECIRIARRTRRIVAQNIAFSIAMKTVFLAFGAAGCLPLWLAVFGDVGVMLLAVLNSMRVRTGGKKDIRQRRNKAGA